MKMVYDIKSGHGKPDSKNKRLYDITYKCGYCGSELSITKDSFCSRCGRFIDWLKILNTQYEE